MKLKQRRKDELRELASLTGKDMNTWQQDISAASEETNDSAAQYNILAKGIDTNKNGERKVPAGLVAFAITLVGGAGFMRWKGLI